MNEEELLKYRKEQGLNPIKRKIEGISDVLLEAETVLLQSKETVKELFVLLDKPEITEHFRHIYKVEDVLEYLVNLERIIKNEKVIVKNLNKDIEFIKETFNLVDKYVEDIPKYESMIDNTDLSEVIKAQFTYSEKDQPYRDNEIKNF